MIIPRFGVDIIIYLYIVGSVYPQTPLNLIDFHDYCLGISTEEKEPPQMGFNVQKL